MQGQLLTAAPGRGHPIRQHLARSDRGRRSAQAVRDDSDLKLFALSFTAFFISIYTFLL